MKFVFVFMYPLLNLAFCAEIKREKDDSRQLQYMNLITELLKETNLLRTFDGVLLTATAYLASLALRFKPFLVGVFLSYFLYAGLVILVPGQMSRLGFPVGLNPDESKMSARSANSDAGPLDGLMSESAMRTFTFSPVTNVITNVTVISLNSTMSTIRAFSSLLVQRLSALQGNMSFFTRAVSNQCVAKFLCRVGQLTEVNLPLASSFLRSLANSYPGLDDFAVAVVRGTSSTNCSLIYPDCTV